MELDAILQKIEDDVDVGDRVTIETSSSSLSGPVVRLDPLSLDPTSGVVVEYNLLPSGSVVETRWDDRPEADPAETREVEHGYVESVTVDKKD